MSVDVRRPELVLWFGLMGSLLLAFLGLLTSIWAEKFDHAAAVSNFVVTPLSLLSGTFYSVDQLSPALAAVSHANPFFYVISGFRAGFLGVSDSPLLVGGLALLALNIALWVLCYAAPQERLEDQELSARHAPRAVVKVVERWITGRSDAPQPNRRTTPPSTAHKGEP